MGIRGPLEGLNNSGFRIIEHGRLACSCKQDFHKVSQLQLAPCVKGDLVDLAEARQCLECYRSRAIEQAKKTPAGVVWGLQRAVVF